MHRVNNISKLEDKIKEGKKVEIDKIDYEQVTNIKDIRINKKRSSIARILDFLRCVENPYIIKVNETTVRMQFSTKPIKAEDCVNKLFYNLYLKH